MSKRDELVAAIAKVIEGLGAPYSIQPSLVGTAGPAWVRARDLLGLFGWNTAEEIEAALRRELFEEVPT